MSISFKVFDLDLPLDPGRGVVDGDEVEETEVLGIAVVAVVVAGTGEVFSGKESAVGNGKLKDERSESNRVSVVSFECSRSSGPASGFRIIRPILLAALDALSWFRICFWIG